MYGAGNDQINPSKPEICDNLDNNCAGGIDDGCDDDNDNYCDANYIMEGTPTTCTSGGFDCVDTNPADFPGSSSFCLSGTTCVPHDQDGDGIASFQCGGNDCNDNDANAYPGAAQEPPGVTVDRNCDGKTYYWRTVAQQTFSIPTNSCGVRFRYVSGIYSRQFCQSNGWTDYNNIVVDWNAAGVSYNYDDCSDIRSQTASPSSITCYRNDWVYDFIDNDGDGYGIANGDCNDNDPAFKPGVTEVYGDPDYNCDGKTWKDGNCVSFGSNYPIPNTQRVFLNFGPGEYGVCGYSNPDILCTSMPAQYHGPQGAFGYTKSHSSGGTSYAPDCYYPTGSSYACQGRCAGCNDQGSPWNCGEYNQYYQFQCCGYYG